MAMLFVIFIGGVASFASVFAIGSNTVMISALSPDEKYVAEVVDSDQGAWEDIDMYWADNDTLVINSKEYDVKALGK